MSVAAKNIRRVAAEKYDAMKKTIRQRKAALVAAGQEIAPLPPIENPQRRAAAAASLREFCQRYFPEIFYLNWSADMLRVVEKSERAVRHGALFMVAMPRGSGKSAIARATILWALLNGYRRFCVLIAATSKKAIKELSKIKTVCETNRRLIGDYPESLYPIAMLQRVTQRQKGQTYLGEFTRIEWLSEMVVFPTIQESKSSGAIMSAAGLESGDIRGQSYQLPGGELLRPDFVYVDDPQTKESAKSRSQSADREELLTADVLGMAGPDKKIAAMACVTVIRPGDMADVMLDRDKHPEWNSERTKMVYAWPENTKLWEEYVQKRAAGIRAGDGGATGTAFYRSNRAAMDAGAIVAWPEKFFSDEISAIQSAMNLRLDRGDAAFFAEYQNDPLSGAAETEFLDADAIAKKVNGFEPNQIPVTADTLTMYQDVHGSLLYYMVCAWEANFTGYILDYGAFPDQHRRYYTLKNAQRTLARAYQGAGREGAIYSGLRELNLAYQAKQWKRDDGALLKLNLVGIDSNWETATVHKFIREFGSNTIFPFKGVGLTAASQPWDERQPKPGERSGNHCRLAPTPHGTARGRHIVVDVNWWKTFVHQRLAAAQGDAGSLSLYGARRSDGQPASIDQHRLLSEHLTSEDRHQTFGRGRACDEWRLRPGGGDNHLFDCLVGCAVLASIAGASVTGGLATPGESKTEQKPHGTKPPARAARKARYL